MAIDVKDFFPRFLLEDRNGYAHAMAFKVLLEETERIIQNGLDVLQDVDKMPEWRLDQLAWEYNCLYDYRAAITAKREWIRMARPIYRILGTAAAIRQYLQGYFDNVQVEEWFDYGAEPFHFRVTCSGDVTSEAQEWAIRAINRAKNVRSTLDGIYIYKEHSIILTPETPLIAVAQPVTFCGDDLMCCEEWSDTL